MEYSNRHWSVTIDMKHEYAKALKKPKAHHLPSINDLREARTMEMKWNTGARSWNRGEHITGDSSNVTKDSNEFSSV